VEGHNFDIRKQLLEYDDVMNQQREVIYRQRREALGGKSLESAIKDIISEKAEEIAWGYVDEKVPAEEWDWKGLGEAVFKQFNFHPDRLDEDTLDHLTGEGLAEIIEREARRVYKEREAAIGEDHLRQIERIVMLQTVDNLWKDHLLSMDHLKEGIGLRGYAQQDPLLVYKKEGFEMFQDMIARIKEETLGILYRVQLAEPERMEAARRPDPQRLVFSHGDGSTKKKPVKRDAVKIGRNDPCPCGSGKKFKKCCGA
jgi:preprotein translocase subunit SecA